MPKVSIIIVNYKGWQETAQCLQSLLKSNYPSFEVFVVENGSPNNSSERLEQFIQKLKDQNQKVNLIQSKENLGFARGCNLGIKTAQKKGTDYFLLLNPDTVVTENFLKELVKVAENPQRHQITKNKIKQGKKLGFLGPRIIYQDKKTVYSNGGFINRTLTSAVLKDHGRDKNKLREKEPFLTDYVTGTALLLSKKTLDDLGLMDESYFLYYEDSDWALRAAKKNYFHIIVPNAIIFHKGYHATGYLSFDYIYYLTRNGYYLAWKDGNLWQKTFVVFYSFYKLLKQPLKIFLPQKRKWIRPILRATWDFWRGKKGRVYYRTHNMI